MKLKDIYDSIIFHGRLTEEEVYDLCKAELTNHGKQQVYIWFLHESDGQLQGRIYGYRPNETVPFIRHNDVQQVFHSYWAQTPGCNLFRARGYHGYNHQIELNTMDFVERKHPHQLQGITQQSVKSNSALLRTVRIYVRIFFRYKRSYMFDS